MSDNYKNTLLCFRQSKIIINELSKGIMMGLSIIVVLLFNSCNSESKQNRPNIVFIMADDLGVPQLGCYGSNYYQTPNIDQLAKEGLRFTNAYAAAAICSPTRASIMTGKYPARLKITDFIPGNGNNDYPLKQPSWQKSLPLSEITFAEVLKSNGYTTAWLGKWHLSKKKTPPESLIQNPDKQGFDDTFVTYKPSISLPIRNWQSAEIDAHNVDTLTNRAISFLEQTKKDTPFFLAISHNTIHDPLMEKESLINKYQIMPETAEKENHPVIAAMMETLDNSVGTILNKIVELGLNDNTVVIFYSDNGSKHSYASQTPYRKGKGWLYEGGIRVPLIIKWPGTIEQGVQSNQMVSSIDLFPTFAEITNTRVTVETDGISFAKIFDDNKAELNRNTMYWHYPHYHGGSGMRPASAIRSKNYKLIEWYEAKLLNKEGAYELFDLEKDPGEKNDLSSQIPEKVTELRELLNQWKQEVGAQEPSLNNIQTK